MFISGTLISLLTFPGVMIHEWAHKKFCDWTGVKVHKVAYFNPGKNPAGYVLHEQPTKYSQTFWISVGPLVINSLLTILIVYLNVIFLQPGLIYFVLFWIALSVGMHSFPSDHDASHILNESKKSIKNGGSSLHYFAYPFFALIWLANKLSTFWFDFWYAAALMNLGYWLV